MNIKHLIIYITIQVFHYIVLGYYPSIGAEVSMSANETLKNLAYAHYENPNKATPLKKQSPKGMKFQEGGSFNMDRIRTRGAEAKNAREATKSQETKQKAEQVKANILIFGTIGLASLFFIIAIIIFYILYKRNNNLHINQNP